MLHVHERVSTKAILKVAERENVQRQQESLKSEAAKRWVAAVNNWNRERLGEPEQQGRWAFHVCEDPQRLTQELEILGGKN